ncbi:MAG: hypothetical protein V1837_06320 [Candidatus Woesearchaeota archaeon]
MNKSLTLTLIIICFLVIPLVSANLGGKEYPRPGVIFTVAGEPYTYLDQSAKQTQFNPPNTMAINALPNPGGNVASVKLEEPLPNDYPKAVEYLFQTCYAQGVMSVTYTDVAKGTKLFLILYCPWSHSKNIRLAPTTGPNYRPMHRDVQYNYPYTAIGASARQVDPSSDEFLLRQFDFYVDEQYYGVSSIEPTNAGVFAIQFIRDPKGSITAFKAGATTNDEINEYQVTSVSKDKITVQNQKTKTVTTLQPAPGEPNPVGTTLFTFKEKSGSVVGATGPQQPFSKYVLEPREQSANAKTLELVGEEGNPAILATETTDAWTLCGKKFGKDNLYMTTSGSEAGAALLKVTYVSEPSCADGPEQYYAIGYSQDDQPRFIQVYCGQPSPATAPIALPTTTTPAPDKDYQCGTNSKITQAAQCKPGGTCEFTFTVTKGTTELPKYCLIGFIDSGSILTYTKKVDGKDVEEPLRWIITCDKLASGKKLSMTLPEDAQHPKVFLFPFQPNIVENYLVRLNNSNKTEYDNFVKAIATSDGYQTAALTSMSNEGQCDSTHGGASQPINIPTIATSSGGTPKQGQSTTPAQSLGKNLGEAPFDKIKDGVVYNIKDGETNTGFVLLKITDEIQKAEIPPGGHLSRMFELQARLFNNYPVINYMQWYYLNGGKSVPQNGFTEIKSYDVYCLRQATTNKLAGTLSGDAAINYEYSNSLGKCGAYLFFPKGTTGTINLYKKTSAGTNKETILSLEVTGATRIMTQHLPYNEAAEMLQYGFWTTTIPQAGKPVTVSLSYASDATRTIPVAACAAGSIQLLSADFRESTKLEISDSLQPTRAFLGPADFAYCSAAGEISTLFPNKTLAYVKGTKFISSTALKTTIVEPAFITLALSPTATAPFEIIGSSSKGRTNQGFTADVVVRSDETFASSITLTKPAGAFEREYSTTHDGKVISRFKTVYNNSKWTVKLLSVPNKFTEGFVLNSYYPDGDLVIDFDATHATRGHGPYHSITVKEKKATAPNKTSTQQSTNKVGGATITGNAVDSTTVTTPANQVVTIVFESTKPDQQPMRLVSAYSSKKNVDAAYAISEYRAFATYETSKTPEELRRSVLLADQNTMLAAKENVGISWSKGQGALGTVDLWTGDINPKLTSPEHIYFDVTALIDMTELENGESDKHKYLLVLRPKSKIGTTSDQTPTDIAFAPCGPVCKRCVDGESGTTPSIMKDLTDNEAFELCSLQSDLITKAGMTDQKIRATFSTDYYSQVPCEAEYGRIDMAKGPTIDQMVATC